MLVLTRKPNEAVMIGDGIEITILSVEGEQIKLGINAPKNVDIHRKEIYLSIQQENRKASNIETSFLENVNEYFKKNS